MLVSNWSTELARQLEAHILVVAEAAGHAQLLDGNLRPLGQRVLEAARRVRLRQIAQRQREGTGRQQQAGAQASEREGAKQHGLRPFQ
jgi:hypothetical protein